MRQLRSDDGIATVLGVVLALGLAGAGIVMAGIVSATTTRQHASVAADLAALAGATHGCDAAALVAQAHGAATSACHFEGADAVVTVAMPAPAMLDRLARWSGHEAPVIASTSRAGPG
jgi:secretion/DNA translocation related TadE-like protein